jgi:3-polyprenyl-4-hydroxybenzoate decarboxylase
VALASATSAASGIHMLLTLRSLNVEIHLIISQEHGNGSGNALTRDASALYALRKSRQIASRCVGTGLIRHQDERTVTSKLMEGNA